jgi:hypothetical protein
VNSRTLVVPVAAVVLAVTLAACGGGSAATDTPTPAPSAETVAPTATLTPADASLNASYAQETDAWYCATAWGALTDEQANLHYPGGLHPLLPNVRADVPQKVLDLIDHYCFDKPVSYIP